MTETQTQTIARRPYTTEEGTPERRLEVKARLAEIQAAKDEALNQFLPVMGSTLTPEDFSQRVNDKDRHEWTPGKLRLVIAAAAGRRVIITTDKQTGHTLIGARLRGMRRTPGYGTYQVLVEWEYAPGKTQGTWTSTFSIGHSITVMDGPLRFAAADLAREESSAAIAAARAALPQCTYGAWRATPQAEGVRVAFTPQREDGGPESVIHMDLTADGGFRAGKAYHYRGCAKDL